MADGTGGTYTLLVDLARPATVEVGSLGAVELPAGHYAYTGSALGPGGFARVDRHREIAAGERDVTRWHVDYLLSLDAASVAAAIRSPGEAVECAVAAAVGRDDAADATVERVAAEQFGATDCGCDAHLAYAPDRAALYRSAWAAHERARER